MFTNKIYQVPKKYARLNELPGTRQIIEATNTETEVDKTEAKRVFDPKASNQIIKDIFKKEDAEKNKKGSTAIDLNKNLLDSFDRLDFLTIEKAVTTNPDFDKYFNPKSIAIGPTAPERTVAVNTVSETQNNSVYSIKSGDTLFQVAKAYGMSLTDLQALNPDIRNLNSVKVGQSVNVKGELKSPVQVASKPKATVTPGKAVEAAPIVVEKPKTPQEELAIANADMKQAQEILTVVAKSGDTGAIDTYTKALQAKIAKVGELQKIVVQQEQLTKAQEAYDKLSPNQKILADYKDALQRTQDEIRSLQANNAGFKNQSKINEIAQRASEINKKIETCNVLIENDNQIAKINGETLAARKYYKQDGPFDLQIKNDAKTALLAKDNDRLIATLEVGNVKKTMLAKARIQNTSSQAV